MNTLGQAWGGAWPESINPMMNIGKYFTLIFFLPCAFISLQAQNPPIQLTSPIDTFIQKSELSNHYYIADEAGIHDRHIKSIHLSGHGVQLVKKLLSEAEGKVGSEIYAFNIRSDTSARFFLSFGLVPEADYYFLFKNGDIVQKKAGVLASFPEIDIPQRSTFIKINFPQDELVECVVHIKTHMNLSPRLKLIISSDETFWFRHFFSFYFWQALFLGAVALMICYNIALYLGSKDKAYLYYVGYLSCGVILFFLGFGMLGLFYPHVEQSTLFLIYFFSRGIAYSIIIFYLIFMRSFLNTAEVIPHIDPYIKRYLTMRTLAIPGLVFLDVGISNGGIVFVIGMLTDLSFIVWVLGSIVKTGEKQAQYFVAGSCVLIIAALCTITTNILGNTKVLPDVFLQIGILIEIIFFSMGLGYRARKEIEARRKAQQQLLLEQERINTHLEAQINIRTAEVEQQREELYRKNQHLELTQKQLLERHRTITQQKKVLESIIEKLKHTQVQLVQAEKMASLGQLTAGIAHEINNPINFVSTSVLPLKKDIAEIKELIQLITELGKEPHPDWKKIRAFCEEREMEFLLSEMDHLLEGIEDGAMRTKEIVKGLKRFSRLDENDFKSCDINEGIASTLKLLQHELKDRIEVYTDFDERAIIECLPGRINQVFMNILTNAIQAIEGKGKIEISSTLKNDQVHILISDTGKGMSSDIQHKIFEPFFTTKEVGEGTGLGLSISFGIIEQHQGNITVSSEIGKGSTFSISLPISQQQKASK